MSYLRPIIIILTLAMFASARAETVAPGSDATASRDVVVRTTLEPTTGAVVGQHVQLFVDALFRGDMARPPDVKIPEISGAQTLRLETQGTTISDTIDGAPFSGQRFEFAIYPRRGGELEIPAANVTLLDRSGAVTGEIKGQIVRTRIVTPPGVDPSRPLVATKAMTLVERWAPDPASKFNAGDAIVRTITRTADDIPAFAMRDLDTAAPAGVQAYVEPPVSQDRVQRGVLTGRRVDRITYVFEKPGAFELPPVAQPWWDLGAARLQSATGAGASIAVSSPSATVAIGRRLADPAWWRKPSNWALAAAILGGVVAALLSIIRIGAGAKSAWAAYRRRSAHSEAKSFGDLMARCDDAQAPEIYLAFLRWCDRLPADLAPHVRPEAAEIERALFGGHGVATPWSSAQSRRFAERLSDVRSERLRRPTARGRTVLPALNPARPDLTDSMSAE